jgi:uncharacterized protein YabE (DUF348 family)
MRIFFVVLVGCSLVLGLITGCAPKKEVKTITEKETAYYKTVQEEDPALPKGQETVKQRGQTGERVITYRATYANSKLKSKEKIAERITKKPVDMIVVVGTQITEKVVEKIPYETRYTNDSSLEQGKEEVRQNGVEGEKEKTFKIGYKGGKEVSRELVGETVTKEPISRMIARGTQKPVSGPQAGTEPMVYLSRSEEKYHREGCITSSENYTIVTLSEAKAKGATPCSKCNPAL